MADAPYHFDFPAHRQGDVWPKSFDGSNLFKIGPILFGPEGEGVQPDFSLERVQMRFRHPNGRTYSVDSAEGGDALVTITNAATWEAEVGPIEGFLPEHGKWSFEIDFYATGGTGHVTLAEGTIQVDRAV